jgi:hypothetical protein
MQIEIRSPAPAVRRDAVVVVCHDDPERLSGGGVEMLGRLRLLAQTGSRICAVDWRWGAELKYESKPCYDILRLPKRRPREAIATYILEPSPLATRSLMAPECERIARLLTERLGDSVRLVVLDGLHGFRLASYLARRFACRLIYRSHNIEADHRRFQIFMGGRFNPEAAINWPRFMAYDRAARLQADVTAEISEEDLRWRPDIGEGKRHVVNPVIEPAPPPAQLAYKHEVAFVGSLDNPVNAEGLLSLVSLLRNRFPALRLGIYGSATPANAEKWRRLLPNCALTANFSSYQQILAESPVIINPILRSSGMNIKTYESLANGAYVLSTPAGGRGCRAARELGLLGDLETAGIPALVTKSKAEGLGGILGRRDLFRREILEPAKRAYLGLFS